MTPPIQRATLTLLLGLLPLAAQPAPQAPPQAAPAKPNRAWARLAEQLKLTENQKTQIQALHTRHSETAKGLRQAAAEAHRAFQEALHKPETPVDQLRTLHQTMQDKAFDLMMDRRTLDGEIRALLTPEQRTEWDKLLAYRQGMKRGQKGRSKGF